MMLTPFRFDFEVSVEDKRLHLVSPVSVAYFEVGKEQGFKFEMTLADLQANTPKGKSVVKALEKWLHDKKVLPSLDKPALSENIALRLKEEIEKSPENRKLTLPEQAIEKIVKLVEARWEDKT